MKALVLNAEKRTAELQNSVPRKIPEGIEILIQVKAVALNPVDSLYVAQPLGKTGRIVGSDFAGVVVGTASALPPGGPQLGQHVAGFLQGACSVNDRPGVFAEYTTIERDLVWEVPDEISLAEAAGVSLVALTAAQGLWFRLGLKAPFAYDQELAYKEHPDWGIKPGARDLPGVIDLFINGASTSVALYAAQMARISAAAAGKKIRLFGTASKARWDMLKAEPYSYDFLVDYRDEDWPEQIRRLSGDIGVHFAYDCISENDSVEKTSSTLASHGRSAVVRSRISKAWIAGQLPSEPIYGAVWEGLGEEIQYHGFVIKKSPAAKIFAIAFYRWLSKAIGKELKPNPIRSMPGGLEKVVADGFKLLGTGKMEDRATQRAELWMKPVSAEKLVYNL